MKPGIHPVYRKVLFVDASSGDEWVSYTTMNGTDTRVVKGEEIPVVRLDISSFSHPFWTGQSREVDTEGRMDRFRRRYGVKAPAKPAAAAAAPAAAAKPAAPLKAEPAGPKGGGKGKKK
ncbi:MAG TPA: type B 50S ribosomal protein L31 [Nannocystis sp.]